MAWSIAASASNSLAATSFAALRRSVSIFYPLALIHAATSQIRYEPRNSEADVHQAAECKNDSDSAGEDEQQSLSIRKTILTSESFGEWTRHLRQCDTAAGTASDSVVGVARKSVG